MASLIGQVLEIIFSKFAVKSYSIDDHVGRSTAEAVIVCPPLHLYLYFIKIIARLCGCFSPELRRLFLCGKLIDWHSFCRGLID